MGGPAPALIDLVFEVEHKMYGSHILHLIQQINPFCCRIFAKSYWTGRLGFVCIKGFKMVYYKRALCGPDLLLVNPVNM